MRQSVRFAIGAGATLILALSAADVRPCVGSVSLDGGVAAARAALQVEDAKLVAADADPGDRFGHDVAIDADTVIVGAPHDGDRARLAGSAYVYERSAGVWLEQAKLVPADGTEGDRFGSAVAISGDLAVVGAPSARGMAPVTGAAYVFERRGSTWIEQQKLAPADGGFADAYGRAVAISGNRIAVGAPQDDERGEDSGSVYAYFFDGSQWVEHARLLAEDGSAHAGFGQAVALDGDHLLVGAPRDDEDAAEAGAAYFFDEIDGVWRQTKKLRASDPALQSWFGYATALDGDTALVGAHGADGGEGSGSVYVFRNLGNGWNEEARLLASDLAVGDGFGFSVALRGDLAVIGSHAADTAGPDAGAGYTFVREGEVWREREKLVAVGGAAGDELGYSIAVGSTSAVAGAVGAEVGGSAYVFETFRLSVSPDPIVAGEDAVFTVIGGMPLETTFLALSLAGPGDTFIAAAGVALDLDSPFLGAPRTQSDGDGVAKFVVPVPPAGGGREVWCQGVQVDRKTQLLASPVESSP